LWGGERKFRPKAERYGGGKNGEAGIIYDVAFFFLIFAKKKVSKRKDENAGGPGSAARDRAGSGNASGGCQGGLSVGQ
jgi:hypothetical protein